LRTEWILGCEERVKVNIKDCKSGRKAATFTGKERRKVKKKPTGLPSVPEGNLIVNPKRKNGLLAGGARVGRDPYRG